MGSLGALERGADLGGARKGRDGKHTFSLCSVQVAGSSKSRSEVGVISVDTGFFEMSCMVSCAVVENAILMMWILKDGDSCWLRELGEVGGVYVYRFPLTYRTSTGITGERELVRSRRYVLSGADV